MLFLFDRELCWKAEVKHVTWNYRYKLVKVSTVLSLNLVVSPEAPLPLVPLKYVMSGARKVSYDVIVWDFVQ